MNTCIPTKPEAKATPPIKVNHPWLPDTGNGCYTNPVIHADYSDPDAIRVGEDFWMTASSFNCTPGLPILHSKDLVNWTITNHALKNLPYPHYEKVQPGCGIWAPAIRFHAGKYWIFFPTPDEGIFVTTADHPNGQWSPPHLLQEGKGLIDPCPLWDDDGQAYLVHAYAKSRSGIKHMLRVCPMSPDASKLTGEGKIIFHDPKHHPTLEGPKFLKKDGWYYVLAPAGGVETGWQVVLRSRNVYGPYEDKIVLAQGNTDINGPHQGALVDLANGEWGFVHFQDADLYGRIVHLQPVRWEDGWPLMGNNGEPVRHHAKPVSIPAQKPSAPQTSDEFAQSRLGLQWQWQANHRDEWYSLTARPGWLRLFPQPEAKPLAEQPNLLLQKFPARIFSVESAVELFAKHSGEEAGLVITGGLQMMLGIQRTEGGYRIVLRTNEEIATLAETDSNRAIFRVEVQDGGMCSFSYGQGSDFVVVPQKFQARKGTWIGAKVGLYSLRLADSSMAGHVDADYFRFK